MFSLYVYFMFSLGVKPSKFYRACFISVKNRHKRIKSGKPRFLTSNVLTCKSDLWTIVVNL